jgi:hypothetical protein
VHGIGWAAVLGHNPFRDLDLCAVARGVGRYVRGPGCSSDVLVAAAGEVRGLERVDEGVEVDLAVRVSKRKWEKDGRGRMKGETNVVGERHGEGFRRVLRS